MQECPYVDKHRMKYNPDNHHRRSTRLNGYDYSQAGAYFVTVCAKDRECVFGDIVDEEMRLNEYGKILSDRWDEIPDYFAALECDGFVVMPNHIHGIIMIVGAQFIAPSGTITFNRNGAMKQGAINRAPTVGEIVRVFKARCTHDINEIRNTPGLPVWQRNYYEHVIRNEEDLTRIRKYIVENPLKWSSDEDNPANIIRKGLINQTPTNNQ